MRKPYCCSCDMNKSAISWSRPENQKLINYIRTSCHGDDEVCWTSLPQSAGLLHCGKSCRLRWLNHLRPEALKQGRNSFAEDEEDLIIKLHKLLGNRWSLIAGRLPGRTDNEVKKYWNSHLRKKLIKMGIDPNNHRLRRNDMNNIAGRTDQDEVLAVSSSNCTTSSATNNSPSCSTRHQHEKSHAINSINNHVSDAGSSVEKGKLALPDLNLELTLNITC